MSAPNEQSFHAPPPPPMPESAPRAPRPTKLRPIAIGLFVLGLIVLGAAFAKLLPGSIGTGAAICFAGVLLFALSFIPLPMIPEKEQPLSFLEKVTGVFYEP